MPFVVIVNVAIIFLLPFESAIRTLSEPIWDWVRDEPGTNLNSVWSRYNIKECGILYFSTLWAISWKKTNSISSLMACWIATSRCSSFLKTHSPEQAVSKTNPWNWWIQAPFPDVALSDLVPQQSLQTGKPLSHEKVLPK